MVSPTPDDARHQELRSQLLALKQVVTDLTEAQGELSLVLQAQAEGRAHQWAAADPSMSVQARDRLADFNVLDHSLDVLKIKGEIHQLLERRNLLLLLIDILRGDDWSTAVGL